MAIGVPESEVFQAADAVLARGERPTVERVRTELGRGSPARVGQLLEQWWEQLAQRLKGHALLPELPGEVAQAFAEAWRLALAQGDATANTALVAERNALVAEQTALAQERNVWEIALAEAQTNLADHAAQRASAERQLSERQVLVDQLSAQVADLAQQRNRLQAQLEQQQGELATLRTERTDTQEHVRIVEDRAHQQVDHARQELKVLQQRLEREQRERGKVVARFTMQQENLRAALQKAEQNVAHQAGRVAALEATVTQWQRTQSIPAKRAPRKTPSATTAKSRRRPKKASP
ncbi:MAG: DNA-binding protein [Xanthomonadaceae bacterium]|nr:DNA-binding protein [Xanthomonadaceae bacterium]MDE2316558.1 DNA-binding protein [Xanthomonadaceae bacterium]